MVVKENLSTSGEDVFDELDSSVTRYVDRGKGDVLEMRANDGTERIRSSERFSRRRG